MGASIRSWSRWLAALVLSTTLACATTPAPTPEQNVPDAGSNGDSPVFESTAGRDGPESPANGSASTEDPATDDDGVVEEIGDGEADADGDKPVQGQKAPSGIVKRAESTVEGVIIGTVIGGQIAGGYGAAVGAAVFGLYSLITGDVPFDSGQQRSRPGAGTDADEALEEEIEEELERQSELESEIEEELRRQEELLAAIEAQEEQNAGMQDQPSQTGEDRAVAMAPIDPLEAPQAPVLPSIPATLFEQQEREVGGAPKNVQILDADRDGRPEVERVIDRESGALETVSRDTNYDGRMDSQYRYDRKTGALVETSEDTDQDGTLDTWTTYDDAGRGARLEKDRDNDGKRDFARVYSGGRLQYEEFDDNGDGLAERRVEYGERSRTVAMEDRNGDQKMDFWTYYEPGGRPVRVEKDTTIDGKPNVFEYYEGPDPANMTIVRKEEDLNGDGAVDQISYYENGKLSRREILNPAALSP
jgi:antitoxin component YwqK of YwqJK toxin-antitoxin module